MPSLLTLIMSCRSVAECEAVIKKLYCQLGWEYRDSDSGDEKVDSMKSAINADDEGVLDCGKEIIILFMKKIYMSVYMYSLIIAIF